MKRKILVTEKELVNTIKDCINEISINAKKRNIKDVRNAFEKGKGGWNAIKTFAVFTAENPDSQQTEKPLNRKLNKSLISDLKTGGYNVIPAKGKFGNVEHPFMVFNIPLDACKYLCGKYQQTSFVYHILENGKVISQYWEKADAEEPYDKKTNDYIKKDENEKYVDESESDDMYTSIGGNIGKEFKYSIPFSIFNEENERMNNNLDFILEKRKETGSVDDKERLLEYAFSLGNRPSGNGMYRLALRKAINR